MLTTYANRKNIFCIAVNFEGITHHLLKLLQISTPNKLVRLIIVYHSKMSKISAYHSMSVRLIILYQDYNRYQC